MKSTVNMTAESATNAAIDPLDVQAVRRDFPILAETVRGKPLVYLDNAATAQKPNCVIEAITEYYRSTNANIHRGVHALSVAATDRYEKARLRIQRHLGAEDWREIIFVRGATEALNLVAQTYGRAHVGEGDEILISVMEHHSNIVPWQMLARQVGAKVIAAPLADDGSIELDSFESLLSPRTKIVAVTHVSNSLGTINPVKRMAEMAKAHGAIVVVDGAQAVPHMAVDVRDIGCDFYAFSSHKAFGPTGVGALYGRRELLDTMDPYQGGGEMIKSVTFERTVYNEVPFKFEAGTPNIAGAIGLGEALRYLEDLGLDRIAAYEDDLLAYGTAALTSIPGLRMVGTAQPKAAVFSFVLGQIHAHDIGTILDGQGIAVRTGHHCTQPVMERYGVPATTRASLAFYNTKEEIDTLVRGLSHVVEIFSP
ncbi:MAG: SufS family cysteine desulfurase [Planctomycetota bacterium]|jgi:cysteine desulfurase/selenocysteine lyase